MNFWHSILWNDKLTKCCSITMRLLQWLTKHLIKWQVDKMWFFCNTFHSRRFILLYVNWAFLRNWNHLIKWQVDKLALHQIWGSCNTFLSWLFIKYTRPFLRGWQSICWNGKLTKWHCTSLRFLKCYIN